MLKEKKCILKMLPVNRSVCWCIVLWVFSAQSPCVRKRGWEIKKKGWERGKKSTKKFRSRGKKEERSDKMKNKMERPGERKPEWKQIETGVRKTDQKSATVPPEGRLPQCSLLIWLVMYGAFMPFSQLTASNQGSTAVKIYPLAL